MANKTFSVDGEIKTAIHHGQLFVEIDGEVNAEDEEIRLLIESIGVKDIIYCLKNNFEKELMQSMTGGELVEALCKWPKFVREKYIKLLKARD